MRISKAADLSIFFGDRRTIDVADLLSGKAQVRTKEQLVAFAPGAGRERPLSRPELEVLLALVGIESLEATELIDLPGVDKAVLEGMLEKGLLQSDAAARDPALREQRYAETHWYSHAATYHFLSRWKDATSPVYKQSTSEDRWEPGDLDPATFNRHALAPSSLPDEPAPPHFYRLPGSPDAVALPEAEDSTYLLRLLEKRRTVRLFDRGRALSQRALATVLRSTFGAHGYNKKLSAKAVVLRRSSPSGGALHPIEAYPFVINVEGLSPGLYHYDCGGHRLELIRELKESEALSLAVELTAGQRHYASAHVLFILTARFYRNFWKYRRHSKAYKVLLLDAGHLSQTLYLVCTEMDLGAFFTGAVNDINIEEALGLDPLEQGVVGICGCGHPVARGEDLSLHTEPYVPGSTDV